MRKNKRGLGGWGGQGTKNKTKQNTPDSLQNIT